MTSHLWVLGPSVASVVEATLREVGERAVSESYAGRTAIAGFETLYLVACDIPVTEGVEVHRIERRAAEVGPPLVGCTVCHMPKCPRGRDPGLAAANGYCDWKCQGYAQEPHPSRLWPRERVEPDPSRFLADSVVGQVVSELARLGRLPSKWQTFRWDEAHTLGSFQQYAGTWGVFDTPNNERRVPASLVMAAASETPDLARSGALPGVDPSEFECWMAEQ